MAFKIVWSRQARDDLRDIVTFIAANDRTVAESFGFRLVAKVDLLAQYPQIRRPQATDLLICARSQPANS
jgi:plasmid stabilization system protein ParE